MLRREHHRTLGVDSLRRSGKRMRHRSSVRIEDAERIPVASARLMLSLTPKVADRSQPNQSSLSPSLTKTGRRHPCRCASLAVPRRPMASSWALSGAPAPGGLRRQCAPPLDCRSRRSRFSLLLSSRSPHGDLALVCCVLSRILGDPASAPLGNESDWSASVSSWWSSGIVTVARWQMIWRSWTPRPLERRGDSAPCCAR